MDIQIEVKEELVYPNPTLSEVKSESGDVEDSANLSEMCSKSQPSWTESAGAEIKETEVQTGNVTAEETTRLYTESMCRNSNSVFSFFTRRDSGEKKDHSYSRQSQGLEEFEANVLHSDLKGYNLVQTYDTEDTEICAKKFIFVPTLCKVEKLYACEICNKSFLRISHLKQHEITHEVKRPHVCGICDKSFVHASVLKNHKLTHEDVRSYTCDICNKCFSHVSTFKEHILIHELQKPLKCETCNKMFTYPSCLRRHELTHEVQGIAV